MGLRWLSTLTHTSHDVDDDQLEPGVPKGDQPREHALDFVLMDWSLAAGLGLSDWLEVELTLPVRLIRIDASFADENGTPINEFDSIHHRDETLFGIGDLMLGGRFRVSPSDSDWAIDLVVGVSLPTGKVEDNPFARGRVGQRHQHMFFGTGTFDPQLGVNLNYRFELASVYGWGSARASLYENTRGYTGPGNYAAGVGVSTGFGLESWRFNLGPEVMVETPATWSGEQAKNSGRTDIIASGGATWSPSEAWDLQVVLKAPFTVQSEGGQLQTPLVVLAGVTWRFAAWTPDVPVQ